MLYDCFQQLRKHLFGGQKGPRPARRTLQGKLFRPTTARYRPTTRLDVEALEERWMPSTVNYYNGPVLDHVQVEPVFIGNQWNTDSDLSNLRQQLTQFLKDVTNSPYMDQFREYSVDNTGIGRGGVLPDIVLKVFDRSLGGNPDGSVSLDSNFARGDIRKLLSSVAVPATTGQPLLMAFLPAGVHASLPGGVSTNKPLSSVYPTINGFHDRVGDQGSTPYALITHPFGNASSEELAAGFSPLDVITRTASHELAEAITDPQGNGWNNGDLGLGWIFGEVADLSEKAGPGQLTVGSHTYWVDKVYSNLAHDQGADPNLLLQAPNMSWSKPNFGLMYELGVNGTLWKRTFSGLFFGGESVTWTRADANVSSFAVDLDELYTLHPDGTLAVNGRVEQADVQSFLVVRDSGGGAYALHQNGSVSYRFRHGAWSALSYATGVQVLAGDDTSIAMLHQGGWWSNWPYGKPPGADQSHNASGGNYVPILGNDGTINYIQADGQAGILGFNASGSADFRLKPGGILETRAGDSDHAGYSDSNVQTFVVAPGGQWAFDLRADGTLNVNWGDGWKPLDTGVKSLAAAGGASIYELKQDGTFNYLNPSRITVTPGSGGIPSSATAHWSPVDTCVQSIGVAGNNGIRLYELTNGGLLRNATSHGWQILDSHVQSFALAFAGERLYWLNSAGGLLRYQDDSGWHDVVPSNVTDFVVGHDGFTVHYVQTDHTLRRQDTRNPSVTVLEATGVLSGIQQGPLDNTFFWVLQLVREPRGSHVASRTISL